MIENSWFNRLRKPIPLQFALVGPFVLQTVGAVALVGYLSYRSGQQATEDLANQLLQQTSERVSDRLSSYLHASQQIVAANQLAVNQGTLDLNNREQLRQHLWQQIILNSSIPANMFWRDQGSGLGYGRIISNEEATFATQAVGKVVPPGSLYLSENYPNQRQFYAIDSQGKPRQLVYTFKEKFYDPGWYRQAKALGKPYWSAIHSNPVTHALEVTAIAPTYNATGKFQGLFTSSYYLAEISTFLNTLNFSPAGQIFIIERSGHLVATSILPEASGQQGNGKPTRSSTAMSRDEPAQAISQQLLQQLGDFHALRNAYQLSVTVKGQRQFVRVTPYQDNYSLDWLVVTVIPESDFMAAIQQNMHVTTLLCLLTLGGAIALGLFTAKRITSRISRLNQLSQELAAGNLAQRLPVDSSIAEVQELAQSFNQMADQLQQSFDLLQTALVESEEKFTTIFRASPDPIAIINLTEGRFLEANDRLLEFYGYSRDELIDRTTLELGLWASGEEQQQFRQFLATQGYVYNQEVTACLKSGEVKVVLLSAEVCNLQGQDAVIIIIRDINDRAQLEADRQRAERQLRQSEADLKKAQQIAHCGNWDYDIATRQVYWSEEMYRIHGMDPDQTIPIGEASTAYIHPEDHALYYEEILQKALSGVAFGADFRIIHRDGAIRYVEGRGEPVFDEHHQMIGLRGTVQDVTDRKVIEIALQQALQELIHHVENSPLATVRWNREFQVEIWSQQAEQIFGWKAEEVRGKTMYDWQFIFEEDLEHVNQSATQLLQGVSVVCHNRNHHKDGSVVYCEWYNSALLDEQGNLVSILSLARDVTDRKQAEQELQQAKAAAEAANQAKSVFLANMSHELRTPLNAILGFSQLMQHNLHLPPDNREYLKRIHVSGDHLLKLINEILDLAKIEAGKSTLENQTIDLADQLHLISNTFSEQISGKNLQFHLEILPEVPQYVVVDAQKLGQILLNLLNNAIKFTEQGDIWLRVSLSTPPTSPHSLPLLFEVEDTGIGIARQDWDLIFDAFGQTLAGQQAQEGTGLGLTISRRLVQLMGGNITVRSVLGQGSTFAFTIPVETATGDSIQSPYRDRLAIGLAPNQPHYRILVVDDQADNRLLLVNLLQQVGLSVQEATTGEAALLIWQHWHPHLIWMDIRLPGIDGYEVTRQIRALEGDRECAAPSSLASSSSLPPTKIIALTAQALPEDCTRALAAGCTDYINKPFQEAALFQKMTEHLGIQFVYADDNPALSKNESLLGRQPLTVEHLAVMPQEWAIALYQASTLCQEKAVRKLLQQIPPEHAALAHKLEQLSYNFEFEKIMELSKTYLDSQ